MKWLDSVRSEDRGRLEFWDEDFLDRGSFGIRVTKSGVKTWVYMYTPKKGLGRQRRITIGTYPSIGLSDARKKARELSGHSQGGSIDPTECPTVKDLIKNFIENYAAKKNDDRPRNRSWKKQERMLRKDFEALYGNLLAKDVSTTHVHSVLDAICARGSGTMANRTLEVIRKMYNYALERPATGITFNPCDRISKPIAEIKRDRVLNSSELRFIWTALSQESFFTANIFKLLLLTAQRVGEVCRIRREDLDLRESWWIIPGNLAKNGRSHRIPLCPTAIKIIKEVLEYQLKNKLVSPWLFPGPVAGQPILYIHKASARIKANSAVNFRPHDFRRTAATGMASLGIPSFVIGKVLNHTDKSVTAVYDRYTYDREKRGAIEAWEKRLGEILQSAEADNLVLSSQRLAHYPP